MTPDSSDRVARMESRSLGTAAALIILAALGWLYAGLRIVSPIVLVDEYAYMISGRALDRLDQLRALAPTIPQFGNSLFLRLIQGLSWTEAPIDVPAKLINVVAAAISAWILARVILRTEASVRALICVGVIAFYPIGSYAAYVMPESLYLLAFSALIGVLLWASGRNLVWTWMLAGGLLGLMTLIKPHGVFALAAFLAATLAWSAVTRRISLVRASGLCGVALGAFGLVAVGGGLWVASSALVGGGGMIGDFYGEMVRVGLSSGGHFAQTLNYALLHIAGILMLFGPCVAFIMRAVWADRARPPEGPALLSFVGLFLLGLMAIVVVVIAVLVAQEPNRIHLRYLNFALPALLGLTFVWDAKRPDLDTPGFRLFAAALWLGGAAIFLFRLPTLRPLPVDAPELFFAYAGVEFGAFGLGRLAPWLAGGLIFGGAWIMVGRPIRWLNVQVAVLIVLLMVATTNTLIWQGRWSAGQEAARRPGEVAELLCGPREGAIVAMGTPETFMALYPAMAAIDRLVPLSLVSQAEFPSRARALPRGTCLLTTMPAGRIAGPSLQSSGGVGLYRF